MIVSASRVLTSLALVVALGGCARTKLSVPDGAFSPRSVECRPQCTPPKGLQAEVAVQEPTKQGGDETLTKHPWIVLVALLIFTFTVTK